MYLPNLYLILLGMPMESLYDDDGERKIRIVFNDPIHKEEIVGNKFTITQMDEPKVSYTFSKFCFISTT